jgi:biopolymer transport protein ExbD
MARRHHYRRRTNEVPELDVTTFMNLMVVLVPFLLITAVFSRITIVELSLPTASNTPPAAEQPFRVEVMVRQAGLEIGNGTDIIAALPKGADEAYDLAKLSEHLMALKRAYPDVVDASVLLEPEIEYDHLIQVMDTVRTAEVHEEGSPEITRVALFTEIAIGDAP